MITVDNGSIKCSYGDTFAIQFTLENYHLKSGDFAVLSIKNEDTKEVVLSATISTVNNTTLVGESILNFVISAQDMKSKVPIGKYLYDLVLKSANNDLVYTTDFVNTLEVMEVAH